ncbi:uncharacterized protein TNCV_5062451 [Trichonephila clavipes]|nr:uncharacterized protein TNCV_5062451 [Trichonephila clavipes]
MSPHLVGSLWHLACNRVGSGLNPGYDMDVSGKRSQTFARNGFPSPMESSAPLLFYAGIIVCNKCLYSSVFVLYVQVHVVAAVAEWYRYRTVACFVTGSSPVPLKTRRVGQRCTLNLSRAETSSRWCGVVVRRGGPQLRCRPRHLTMVQNYVVRRQKPSCS